MIENIYRMSDIEIANLFKMNEDEIMSFCTLRPEIDGGRAFVRLAIALLGMSPRGARFACDTYSESVKVEAALDAIATARNA